MLSGGTSAASRVQNDSDIQISRENQKKINTFAIRNGWLEEVADELKAKRNEIKNLEDAEAEIILCDDEKIPYCIGDSFVLCTQDTIQDYIKKDMEALQSRVAELEKKASDIRAEMASLKADLYSQFGDSINLENEEAE